MECDAVASITSSHCEANEHCEANKHREANEGILMSTYQELKSKAGEMLKQAEKIRKKEVRTIIAEIRAMMSAYDLTVDDLQPKTRRTRATKATAKTAATKVRKARGPAKRPAAKAKYRNPETGATWTGRGKPPNWIKDVKNRDAFLIIQG